MSTTSRPRKSARRTSPPVPAGSENSGAGWPKRRPVMASQYILRVSLLVHRLASDGGAPAPRNPNGRTAEREAPDEGQRNVPEGRGDAAAAAGRRVRRPLDEDGLRRSRHGQVHRRGDGGDLRHAVDAPRPRPQDAHAGVRRLRRGDGTRARAGHPSPHGAAAGLDGRGADGGADPAHRLRRRAVRARRPHRGLARLRRDAGGAGPGLTRVIRRDRSVMLTLSIRTYSRTAIRTRKTPAPTASSARAAP